MKPVPPEPLGAARLSASTLTSAGETDFRLVASWKCRTMRAVVLIHSVAFRDSSHRTQIREGQCSQEAVNTEGWRPERGGAVSQS